MKRLFRFGLALCCLFVAGSNMARAEKVRIGHMGVINQVELVAGEAGFYKKYDLDIEPILFQTGPSALQGLLSGDLEAVEAGPAPMLNLAAQQLPLYFLVSGGINSPQSPAGKFMVRTDETTIKSFADLRGKKIGQLGKGTITYFWLGNALELNHMTRADIQEIFVPFPQMGGLLSSRQVDAVYAWPPFDTFITLAGQGKVLSDDGAANPYAVINALIVRADWADKNPTTVRKMIKATVETGRWIDDHPDEARIVMGKHLGMPEAAAKAMYMFHFPRNGYQLMPSIWDFYYAMTKSGDLKPFADPKAVVQKYWIDPGTKLVGPAIAELGSQPDPIVADVLKVKLPNLPGSAQDYFAPWEK